MRYCFVLVAVLLTACLWSGCSQGGAPSPSSPKSADAGTNSSKRVFHVKGEVKEVTPEKKKVRISHEKIPGYMDAMTMSFDVKGPSDLESLKPGDSVGFDMVVTDDDGWIENITKLGTNAAPLSATASPEMFRRVRDVEPLQIGDVMPDYHFTNEMGKAVSLSDYKGQALAFTFIYTRCPFPTYCPRMTSNFKSTYKLLAEKSNGPTNWHLLSITIDPQYDTPATLKQYADHQNADPKRWNFVTGELIDVTAIAEQFGLLFWRPEPDKPTAISHNLRTVVIDADGKVYKVLKENEWKPETLAEYITEATKPGASKTAANSK